MRSVRLTWCVFGFALPVIVSGLALSAEVPFLMGRVNDNAGILSAETMEKLGVLLKRHEDSTSNQVVVLTIPSLEGEEIESFSMRVVESWKLGQKGKDNGVLILVSRDDRKIRIEVGRGLEGDLPDITCGIIIRKEIIPHFKEGNYDAGVTAGVEAVLGSIAGSYSASEQDTETAVDLVTLLLGGGIFIVVVGLFTVIGLLTRGGQSWFLYVFLIPFWFAFPMALIGTGAGLTLFGLYVIGFPVAKIWLTRSVTGTRLYKRISAISAFSSSSSGGWSSSSSSGSFSGGGGGFSGGGASGSW